MPRARPPHVRSVQTPEALGALRKWLDTLAPRSREVGELLLNNKQVEKVWSGADHYVEARVADDDGPCGVTLFLTLGKWSSRCSCERRERCQHAYAAALAWIAESESPAPRATAGAEGGLQAVPGSGPALPGGAPGTNPPIQIPGITGPTSGIGSSSVASNASGAGGALSFAGSLASADIPDKGVFRQKYSRLLAKKLGRELTAAEDNLLENLAGLFADFVQSHGTLYPGTLLRHGFEHRPAPGAPLYAPAFAGWWSRETAPADPWALWQYIAYDYELDGRAIPEVLRPLTDTTAIRGTIEAQLLQNDLAAWQRALASADDAATPRPTHSATADLTGLRARVRPEGGLAVETRQGPSRHWRSPPQKWFDSLASARPVDFEHLTPPEAALGIALAAECAAGLQAPTLKKPLPPEATANLFRTRGAREAIVMPDGGPLVVEPQPLVLDARASTLGADRLDLRLTTPDGRDATRATVLTLRPSPLYFFDKRVWPGPPPTPDTPLPTAALGDMKIMSKLRSVGLRLPAALEKNVRRVPLRPVLKAWLTSMPDDDTAMEFHAQLLARADDLPIEQHWINTGWQWTTRGEPPARRPDDPLLEFDLAAAETASAHVAAFAPEWHEWETAWSRPVSEDFPEEFIAWHASLPPGLKIETSPGLANLLGPPLHGHLEFSASPAEVAGRDWFNVSVKLRLADTTLTPDEVALLLKAKGKWVNLPRRGWQRVEIERGNEADDALHRLGLDASDVLAEGRTATHRVHTLQLAAEADLLEARDAKFAALLRERARSLAAQPPPPLPTALRATLRPYQQEGYQFLCHLSALSLGGVLADDMGLGKTVQTLAWLLHLHETRAADAPARRFLVVCPKSVTHGWLVETERFTPALKATSFDPLRLGSDAQPVVGDSQIVVANYTQLRLNAAWFQGHIWDAVVLDEGQFIKNPGSQVATVARSLRTHHRIVLTGTPIENRLTDLWSLFAFSQPGLLGGQSAFRRHYNDANPAARERLHRRVRHFLLRRTKAQAAPELPPRTEDELVVELEGEQRKLYDAELKRARAQLLGIDTHSALQAVRFNVLSSLLRLRQICCHPALIDPVHRDLPSAKLEALLERLEELRDEGHQVLVFSQFVEMLEIIRARLVHEGIGHLMLTGQTENRAELVEEFQRDRSKTVFLLSLKAAGFGLNLTAASYVILYDPWWNPAAEAQAIDRTHRIGQTQPVVAYRLIAEGTVEEKIRLLQREKAALAAAVVQEESLASILDLDALKQILG